MWSQHQLHSALRQAFKPFKISILTRVQDVRTTPQFDKKNIDSDFVHNPNINKFMITHSISFTKS
jgi:hypothetical protein